MREPQHQLRFPDEQGWLRAFVAYHGTTNGICFTEANLGNVSLTHVVETLANGTVVTSDKCETPGTICDVEYVDEDGIHVWLRVFFVSNEHVLKVLQARKTTRRENGGEAHRAA